MASDDCNSLDCLVVLSARVQQRLLDLIAACKGFEDLIGIECKGCKVKLQLVPPATLSS